MPYPITWQPGEILGRNYVPRSNWLDAGTSTTDITPWTSGSLAPRDVANGLGTVNRLAGFTATRVKLDGLGVVAGAQYLLRVLAWATDSAQTVKVGLLPNGSFQTAPITGYDATIPTTSGYVWHEILLTVPPGPYKNAVNADYTPTALDLVFTTTSASAFAVVMVRLDEPGSPISGRLDGGLPDDARFSYEWTGTANRSASTATSLTVYPTPTETPDEPPLASFTASTADLTVTVDASGSSDPEDGVLGYAWTFGDGATASGPTASHTYAEDGVYTVALTVSDPTGNVATATKTVDISLVLDTDPPPVPEEPDAPSLPISGVVADVVTFMGRTGDAALEALAEQHVPVMAELVNAYVRGNGPVRTGLALGEFSFPADLRAVVITASARLLSNPAQLESESSDGYAARGSFSSFSLAEQAVLHRYRRRVA